MSNMSDGKSDGFVLSYVKDGIIYPVALSEENLQMLDIALGISLEKVNLINKPIGKVINLLSKDDK